MKIYFEGGNDGERWLEIILPKIKELKVIFLKLQMEIYAFHRSSNSGGEKGWG